MPESFAWPAGTPSCPESFAWPAGTPSRAWTGAEQLQSEIAHFFTGYKQLENKHVNVEGWYSREDAVEEIEAARRRYRKDASH